jgi:phospholipase C
VWERLEQIETKRRAWRAGATAAGPPPRPSLPAGTDLLPPIRHIVVLMMENHSYDNYLGMLQGRGEGFPLGADGEPEISNLGTSGEHVRAHHLRSTIQRPQVPSQSWHATHHQWGDGKCDGFVTSTQTVVAATDAADAAVGADAAVRSCSCSHGRTAHAACGWSQRCANQRNQLDRRDRRDRPDCPVTRW